MHTVSCMRCNVVSYDKFEDMHVHCDQGSPGPRTTVHVCGHSEHNTPYCRVLIACQAVCSVHMTTGESSWLTMLWSHPVCMCAFQVYYGGYVVQLQMGVLYVWMCSFCRLEELPLAGEEFRAKVAVFSGISSSCLVNVKYSSLRVKTLEAVNSLTTVLKGIWLAFARVSRHLWGFGGLSPHCPPPPPPSF